LGVFKYLTTLLATSEAITYCGLLVTWRAMTSSLSSSYDDTLMRLARSSSSRSSSSWRRNYNNIAAHYRHTPRRRLQPTSPANIHIMSTGSTY